MPAVKEEAMDNNEKYKKFVNRLKLLVQKRPSLIKVTLSNIFTMRLIGNKTHGDLAEIAISEFINQYMYDFRSIHVGKDLYRAKSQEEDIQIIDEINNIQFPVSLKAYGIGPLQLSTDKECRMFPRLQQESDEITDKAKINEILRDPAFAEFHKINVLPLIYNEKDHCCNIMLFDYTRAMESTARIVVEKSGGKRKHPVYRFFNNSNGYICEVRYGDAEANALQRGLWTHTQNGQQYFDSITNGWIDYSDNHTLVKMFSHALVASEAGHGLALKLLETDIARLRESSEI